jgi:IS30 family transposase
MSNVPRVSLLAAIYSLHDKGWSRRRIARELGLNRETVGRYLRLAKPAISTAGFEEPCQAKPAISTTGTMAGRKSQCEPLAEAILAKVEVARGPRPVFLRMYLRTVRGETLMPSLTSSSLAILSSPHSKLSRDISRIKRRSSAGIGGRPGFDFQCHRSRNPARCQRINVFG